MFAEERQNLIVELVNKNGSVRVKDLSEQFSVTEDSIRKDLTLLEKKGLLKKTYGGAMPNRVNPHTFTVSQRKEENSEAKGLVARKAMELIKDGDMIFLDISTVNLELAKLLIQSPLKITVVSNMIDILLEFMVPTQIQFLFVGGHFNRSRDGVVGCFTNKMLQDFRFDLAFLGVVGLDVFNNCVFTYKVEDGLTKSTILSISKRAYMMIETKKFQTDGTYRYAGIEEFTGGILEKQPSEEVWQKMGDYAVDWIVSKNNPQELDNRQE